MGVAENPGKLGPQLPGADLMAMILPEAGVHPGNVSLHVGHVRTNGPKEAIDEDRKDRR